jgi:hypothetical protein
MNSIKSVLERSIEDMEAHEWQPPNSKMSL